jgi:NAD(P)-dependent dehydrogenase (short-subunit alcohol dehydrogenase family)
VSGRLDGKVVLVTGASRNIGGVAASGFAAAGAMVACNDIRTAVAEERAEVIKAAGGEAMAVPGDVTDPDAVAGAVSAVLDAWGHIDVLLSNAVRFDARGLLTMPVDDFRRQVDIVIGGTFVVAQLVARSMIERGIAGSIITVLSTAAWQGQAGNIGYCTAKSGLINFTRSAAMELAPYGIRVNSFTPTASMPDDPELAAGFRTATDKMRDAGVMDFVGQNPWHRLPTPSDYVAPLVFLASDDSTLMTGTNITVDGGALAKYWPQSPARVPVDGTGPGHVPSARPVGRDDRSGPPGSAAVRRFER